MNKLIAIFIVFGLVISAAVRADGAACNTSCSGEQDHCLLALGKVQASNCSDGFRICLQRCNPQRLNTAYLESDTARRLYDHRGNGSNKGQQCAGHCSLAARTCVESGNGRNDCRSAQMLCEDRCSSS